MIGASETGDDVFLVTTEELAKGEGRAWGDLRRPRQCVRCRRKCPPVECQGENCRGARTRPPEVTSSGTASFEAINRVAVSAPKSVRAAKVKVRVIAPGDGTVSISGRGVKPIDPQVSRAGSVTLTLALKPKADKRRRRAGAYRTKGEVLFAAGDGDVSRADVSLEVRSRRQGEEEGQGSDRARQASPASGSSSSWRPRSCAWPRPPPRMQATEQLDHRLQRRPAEPDGSPSSVAAARPYELTNTFDDQRNHGPERLPATPRRRT